MNRLTLAALLSAAMATTAQSQEMSDIEVMVTTADRTKVRQQDSMGHTSVMDSELLNSVDAQHLNQILRMSAGSWLSRGNGQESLLSVRSPVLTGPGSCAEFVMLSDGIPLRGPGFCNVNQLFDSHFEAARGVEVAKGTHGALYGSNAIHGVVNVLSPSYTQAPSVNVTLGSDAFYRLGLGGSAQTDNADYRVNLTATSDGGYQYDSGYKQAKLSLAARHQVGDWQADHNLTLTKLDQDTAGYLQAGKDAYRIGALQRRNDSPEAFRKSSSVRLVSDWSRQTEWGKLQITPFARLNDMTFLMHFLPGQPLEDNGHHSLGVNAQLTAELSPKMTLRSGVDSDYTRGFLRQFQAEPTQTDSAFLNAVLPAGAQYDYTVAATQFAAYSQLQYQWRPDWRLQAGVRWDNRDYDYDNHLAAGNLKDDGSACGFGGCRYTRPASREDSFSDGSLSLGLYHQATDSLAWYIKWDDGYRAPHTAELYRLQNGQQVSDIDGVSAQQWEVGTHVTTTAHRISVSLYHLDKEDGIYRNSDRQFVNAIDTRHRGLELDWQWQIAPQWHWRMNGSWAEHQYTNNPEDGSLQIRGNEVDTAPPLLLSSRLSWMPQDDLTLALSWRSIEDYYLEPQNQHQYAGHDLMSLNANWSLTPRWQLNAVINNLLDVDYAERADYAFGNYRYFVGRPLRGQLSVRYRW